MIVHAIFSYSRLPFVQWFLTNWLRENCYKHWWFSGRILACHAGDRGSNPANATFVFNMNAIFYMWLCRENFCCYKHWWFSGRILACHAGDRGSIPRQCNLCFFTWMQYFIYDCAGQIVDVTSIGGSVVEFSPATRETGVRFPANGFLHECNILYVIVQGKLTTLLALVVQW